MTKKIKKPKNFDYTLNTSNADDKFCILKFSQCDDKHPLWDLNSQELRLFVYFAKKVEMLKWRDIKTYPGLKFENLPNISKPDNIDKDITLNSMRVNQKFRIIGYRQEEFFYVVWFDKNHEES